MNLENEQEQADARCTPSVPSDRQECLSSEDFSQESCENVIATEEQPGSALQYARPDTPEVAPPPARAHWYHWAIFFGALYCIAWFVYIYKKYFWSE